MKFNKLLCALLAIAMLICAIPVVSVSAAEATATVSYSSPAIPANVGDTVKLTSYAVAFTKAAVTEAAKITWSSADIEIKNNAVTPTAAGVYKLTATAGTATKTVYLVVKNANDTEYVLYYDDFSDASLDEYRVIQQTSGAVYSVADGKLVLDASNDGDSYIRLLLPEWLGDFGDYDITTSFTITKTTAKSRWLSLMARIQNNNYPYWQAAIRQNAKASNGTEITERDSSNKWNVTHTAPFTEDISSSKFYEFKYSLKGKNAATYINGNRVLYSTTMTYETGDIGFNLRGLAAKYDYIKVALALEEVKGADHSLNEVRDPSSNIILTPAMVSYVDSAAVLNDIQKNSPAVAVLYVNSALDVIDAAGTKLTTLEDALEKLDNKIIPAFYLKDQDSITAIRTYLAKNKMTDFYFMSDNADIVKSARQKYPSSLGILDCTARTVASKADLIAVRDDANKSYAKVVVLPESAITYDNVQFLQTLIMTVWSKTADTKAAYLKAITAGVNGMVTSDRATLENMFTEYFLKNTMIRPINIIGHRGVPSLAQENTLAGSILAYEKGANMIEMDIYLSKDNVIVVMHDDTIDRTTNGTGNTESFTYAELQKFVVDAKTEFATQPIPTLEDYFKEFKGKDVLLDIEIKSNASLNIEAELKKLIDKYDMADQVFVITFSEAHMRSMRTNLPNVSVGYLSSSVALNESEPLVSLENILKKIQPFGTSYNPSYANGSLGPNLMRAGSYRGVTFWPYTINNSGDFHNYMLYGTYGITTNYSQYVTNYAKRLTAPASEVEVTAEGVDFMLTKTTYGRKSSDAKDAILVTVDSDGLDVKYENGKLSATGSGTATVYFRLAVRTTSGQTYQICSEPVTVFTKSAETTPAETTTVAPDTTVPTTTAPTVEDTPVTTAPETSGGCGGSVVLGVMACIIPAAVVICKKKKQ